MAGFSMISTMNIDLNNSQLIFVITIEGVCAVAFGSTKTGSLLTVQIVQCLLY